MSLTEPINQCGLDVGHGHGVYFYRGLLLLKMSHDVAFKFALGDRWRDSKPEGHVDGVVGDKIVEVALGSKGQSPIQSWCTKIGLKACQRQHKFRCS